jgi:hypothetical protein
VSAQQLLDQAYSRAKIDALAADPGAYAAQLADELPAADTLDDLAALDAALAHALAKIEDVPLRVMRVALDHVDVQLAPATRNVFVTTVVQYAADLNLLAQRAHDAAARSRTGDPARTAEVVVEGARQALALRDDLRAGVLALAASRAAAAIPAADAHARDRKLDEPARRRWSAMTRELEALAAQPTRLATPLPTRLASWPELMLEPDPSAEPTFAQMIELD